VTKTPFHEPETGTTIDGQNKKNLVLRYESLSIPFFVFHGYLVPLGSTLVRPLSPSVCMVGIWSKSSNRHGPAMQDLHMVAAVPET
jgi:hypothetical protein